MQNYMKKSASESAYVYVYIIYDYLDILKPVGDLPLT